MARVRAWIPGASTPSSLVTRIRIGAEVLLPGIAAFDQLLVGDSEIPVEQEVLPLGVTHDPLTVTAELRVVRRQEEQPGQRPLAELLDQVALAEFGMHIPVRSGWSEVDDAHVTARRLLRGNELL